MDIRLLQTFLEVNRCRHFGKAAENLYLTQAAVSARINQLEETLGVRLFERQRGNIQLTPQGETLVPVAESVTRSWHQISQRLRTETSNRPRIAIGSTPGLWESALASLVPGLRKQLPEVLLVAESHSAELLTRRLQERFLDAIFLFEPPKPGELEIVSAGSLRFVLVSRETDVSLDSLPQREFVGLDWNTSYNLQQEHLLDTRLIPAFQTSSPALAKNYLLDNGGAGFLPEPLVRDALGKQLFRVRDARVIEREYFLCWLKQEPQPAAVTAIRNQLKLRKGK